MRIIKKVIWVSIECMSDMNLADIKLQGLNFYRKTKKYMPSRFVISKLGEDDDVPLVYAGHAVEANMPSPDGTHGEVLEQ